ncbi:MAG TPA: sigma-70 family RNA polymerase sigma factor [Polyangiaceae bacterium]|nr:sigma-70 family RNA polymerase sigma factor [Polyangiaceae bacterium]
MTEASLDDTALVSAILADQAGAKQLAWLRFLPTVRRVLRGFGSRFMDEEDVVQEVFLTFFHGLHKLRDPRAVHAFVVAIAIRTAKHHTKRCHRRWYVEQPVAPDLLGEEAALLDDLHARHELARVERLLRTTRPRDRDAFVLHVVAGMTAKEVASALGVSIATAVRSSSRARAYLRCRAQRDPFLTAYV